jgi:hypothetical protein
MRKVQILLAFIFLCSFSLGIDLAEKQDSETVLEIQIENELANRIQRYLEPLVGKTLVFVDLELEYPQLQREFYGTDVDAGQSLPGLPVAKSTKTKDKFGLENKKDMTRIISKNINIIMSEKVGEDKRKEIKKLLDEWLQINSSRDMLLIQYRKLKKESLNVNSILFILLLIIIFLLAIMIKSGFRYLASALQKVKIAEFGNMLRIQGDMAPTRISDNSQGLSNLHISKRKPLPIVLTKNISDEQDYQDYNFMESLSVKNFLKLIKNESNDNIALILSKLDASYSSKIIEAMKEDSRKIIEVLTANNPRSQKAVKEFRNKIYERYSKFKEDRDYKIEGSETLISLINNLPAASSDNLYEQVKKSSGKVAAQIRKHIFLLDDIIELSDDVIKALMKTMHHDLLIKFLAHNENRFRERFFKNMTKRSISILLEDIEMHSDYGESEKEESTNEMLMTIRKILNYS